LASTYTFNFIQICKFNMHRNVCIGVQYLVLCKLSYAMVTNTVKIQIQLPTETLCLSFVSQTISFFSTLLYPLTAANLSSISKLLLFQTYYIVESYIIQSFDRLFFQISIILLRSVQVCMPRWCGCIAKC
jgi:hypothetical protein